MNLRFRNVSISQTVHPCSIKISSESTHLWWRLANGMVFLKTAPRAIQLHSFIKQAGNRSNSILRLSLEKPCYNSYPLIPQRLSSSDESMVASASERGSGSGRTTGSRWKSGTGHPQADRGLWTDPAVPVSETTWKSTVCLTFPPKIEPYPDKTVDFSCRVCEA